VQRFFLVLLGVGFLLWAQTASAGIRLSHLQVGTEHGYLVASCTPEGGFPYRRIDEALKHGVTLRLQFQIVLVKVRKLFRDQVVLKEEVSRLLYYQTVKDVYLVQYVGSTVVPQPFSSVKEALKKAASLEALPIVPLARLNPQSGYRLKVRIVIKQEVGIPFPFKIPIKLLQFLFGDGKIKSNWVSIDFRP
jgi:hypothetical protein